MQLENLAGVFAMPGLWGLLHGLWRGGAADGHLRCPRARESLSGGGRFLILDAQLRLVEVSVATWRPLLCSGVKGFPFSSRGEAMRHDTRLINTHKNPEGEITYQNILSFHCSLMMSFGFSGIGMGEGG